MRWREGGWAAHLVVESGLVHAHQYTVHSQEEPHQDKEPTGHHPLQGGDFITWYVGGDSFWPKSVNFDFGQKGYNMKGHLKRNRMTQISVA